MDLLKAKKIHLIGIKGAGVAGLALLLRASGTAITGSDTDEDFFTSPLLRESGIVVSDFSAGNITSAIDAVVYSSAYPETHPERIAASALGIPQVSYAEALAQLFNAKFGIAVCGSHGKTTTSAMIAYLLVRLGFDPTALVGSTINQLGSNMCAGASEYFVLEADEYQNKFSFYEPRMLVMTNIDYDHPDFFPDEKSYADVFSEFAQKITGRQLVACWDDHGVRKALANVNAKNIITYGWDPAFDYSAGNYRMENGKRVFTLSKNGVTIGDVPMAVIGRYNVSNALAALAAVDTLSIAPLERAAAIISEFTGTARRFEYKGEYCGIKLFDDYAHHPTEIRATLHAIRHQYPDKRIWCAFASHTYSRTRAFFPQFADVFHHIDRVLVLDIFSSARESERLVTARALTDAINAASGNAEYTPTHDDAIKEIVAHARDIDILITMGAGDVYKVADALVLRAKNMLPS